VAAAVAAAVMIPPGAQAESELTVYGHVHNALVSKSYEDPKTDTTVDIDTLASRFGFKANSDLGNGLTGIAHLEIGVNSDKAGANTKTTEIKDGDDKTVKIVDRGGNTSTRLGYVGLSGGFGTVTVGSQNAAFKGSLHMDQSIWEGGIGGTTGSRHSNTIKYANSVGPLSLQVDLKSNDSDNNIQGPAGDGGAIGLKAAVADGIELGLAAEMNEDAGMDNDWIGVSGKVTVGQFFGALGWTNNEETDADGKTTTDIDYTQFWAGADVAPGTSVVFGYGQKDDGKENSPTPSATTFGVFHDMGGGLAVWYEGQVNDDDDDKNFRKGYESIHRVGLRYIF